MVRRALFSSQPQNVSKRLNVPTLENEFTDRHYSSMTRQRHVPAHFPSRFRGRKEKMRKKRIISLTYDA